MYTSIFTDFMIWKIFLKKYLKNLEFFPLWVFGFTIQLDAIFILFNNVL